MTRALLTKGLGTLGLELRRRRTVSREEELRRLIPEITEIERNWIRRCRPYTMTSVERQWALIQAIRYLEAEAIVGDIVECGVWRGGNLILAGLMRREFAFDRKIIGFDTFTGMSAPTSRDVHQRTGKLAEKRFGQLRRDGYTNWCYAPESEVFSAFERETGSSDLCLIKGKCEETLGDTANLPDRIALLRLDTDWYESTRAELDVLYPRLSPGGVLIMDDYGHWQGAKQAVDEFFEGHFAWLHRVDYTCRLYIKPQDRRP